MERINRILTFAAFLLFLSCGLQAQPFTLANDDVGIDHYYDNGNLMGGGAAWFDYDNDGWLDLYVVGGAGKDELYHNNGDGTFTATGSVTWLLDTWNYNAFGAITGDVDNDGDRDLFIFTDPGFSNHLLENNGDGTFTDITAAAGFAGDIAWSTAAAFGDYNLDGYIDLYVGNYAYDFEFLWDSTGAAVGFAHLCDGNWMYLNNGDKTFTNVTDILGMAADTGCVLATAWTDYDLDDDIDMLIANDFGQFIVPNQLLENQFPVDDFEDVSEERNADVGMYGMGIAIGDYDHDMDLDYYVTNIGLNHLYNNMGGSIGFEDATAAAGVEDIHVDDPSSKFTVGWGTAFLDLDNDTWQDLLVSNGHIPALDFFDNDIDNPDRLFHNNGDGTFTEIGEANGLAGPGVTRGLACADYDKDGDIDFVFMDIQSFYTPEFDPILFYRNEVSNGNHWLQVQPVGTVSNPDGYGVKVEITLGSESWLEETHGGSSHASQHATAMHFGLGSAEQADEIKVIWPGGFTQTFTDVDADQILVVVEDTASVSTSVFETMGEEAGLAVRPNPVVNDTRIFLNMPLTAETEVVIYDASGRRVRTLFQGTLQEGERSFNWDADREDGSRVEPGYYLVNANFEGKTVGQNILVVR